ncbi:9853_t:CDS:2, partial [Cetraspora pellucida]
VGDVAEWYSCQVNIQAAEGGTSLKSYDVSLVLPNPTHSSSPLKSTNDALPKPMVTQSKTIYTHIENTANKESHRYDYIASRR